MIPTTSLQDLGAAFVICFITVFLYLKWSYKYWERKNVPYLRPKIPWGNLENPLKLKIGLARTMGNIYGDLKRKGCKHGGIFSVTRPVYVPVDLDYVKNVMAKDFNHFVDRGMYHHEKADPLSANLLTIEGQKWKTSRAKLTPTFTSGKMKAMFQTVLDCGEQMKEAIDAMYLKSKVFEIKEIAGCFTTDVIGSCAFGLACDSFKNPDSEFRKHSRKLFGTSTDRMVRNFLSMSFPKLCKRFGMRLFLPEVTSFFATVIKDVIDHRERNRVVRNDFVQLLLGLKNNKDEEPLTLEEVSAHAFIFFLAGFETSSSTMAFCLYELACNPKVQNELRTEIHDVLAKNGGRLSYECLNEMRYMTQVIEETLRLYPTLPVLNRVCTKDYKLPGTSTTLEKGTKVFVPVFGIHRDPEYYPNPERFDPDRFTATAKASRHPFAFLPFGEGPRICIGLRFGMMQVKIGLIILLRQYSFKLNCETPKPLTINPKTLLMSSVENILLDVEKLEASSYNSSANSLSRFGSQIKMVAPGRNDPAILSRNC